MGIAAVGERFVEPDFSFNPQLGDGVVDALAPLITPKTSKLENLKLADCSLTIEGLRHFAHVCSTTHTLKNIDLSYSDLAGAGEVLGLVCEIPMLEELSLQGCTLTADDIGELALSLPCSS